MLEVNGTGIPCGLLSHFGSGLAGVQSAYQDSIFDEVILPGRYALIIIFVRSPPTAGQTTLLEKGFMEYP